MVKISTAELEVMNEKKHYTKVDLCRELELIGIEMSRNEI